MLSLSIIAKIPTPVILVVLVVPEEGEEDAEQQVDVNQDEVGQQEAGGEVTRRWNWNLELLARGGRGHVTEEALERQQQQHRAAADVELVLGDSEEMEEVEED